MGRTRKKDTFKVPHKFDVVAAVAAVAARLSVLNVPRADFDSFGSTAFRRK